jgi:DNA modification methylase
MKAVPLVAQAITNSSRPGETVLDIFGGSGTTLIVAEQTGRVCRMMELDPKYCDVIVQRWEEYAGQKAELMRSDTAKAA